jgi:hypothetical protein
VLTGGGIATEKITTSIQTGVTLVCKLEYSICKEFFGLLPTPQHIVA